MSFYAGLFYSSILFFNIGLKPLNNSKRQGTIFLFFLFFKYSYTVNVKMAL